MSDCVYVAWAAGAKDLGIKPKNGSRQFFEGARSFFGESEGLWAGAAPLVVGLLCSAHNMTLTVDAHPWFDRAYYREAARSEWQNWAVASWTRRALWRELAPPPPLSDGYDQLATIPPEMVGLPDSIEAFTMQACVLLAVSNPSEARYARFIMLACDATALQMVAGVMARCAAYKRSLASQ